MAAITFKKQQLNVSVPQGCDLIEAYRKDPDLPMKFGCTRGGCGVCAMEVFAGRNNLTKKSQLEKETLKKAGLGGEQYRLGCQCALNGDVEISFLNADS